MEKLKECIDDLRTLGYKFNSAVNKCMKSIYPKSKPSSYDMIWGDFKNRKFGYKTTDKEGKKICRIIVIIVFISLIALILFGVIKLVN